MKQLIEDLLQQACSILKEKGVIPLELAVDLKLERSKDSSHGDFATNLALTLAKPCQRNPREIAQLLLETLANHPDIARVEMAGPGFINFFVAHEAQSNIIATILREKEKAGCSTVGKGQKVLLEYVSANPTGPLHVGHGRGAAFGATLANILKAAGFEVSREYYVNDAGRQMDILAVSVWLRYLTLAGETITFPANGYRGEYVIAIAQSLFDEYGITYLQAWSAVKSDLPLDEPEGGDKEQFIDALIVKAKTSLGKEGFARFHQHALDAVLADIKDDLEAFGVDFDQWFREQSLVDDGALESGIAALKNHGHTYLKEGALWFKATDFGDEKDRVLIRANGQATYFASDVAYHWNKYDRGFDKVVDIFGADHHGYVSRIRAAVTALGHDEQALTCYLVQFAILYRHGERVQMSTRSGSFVTLRELREEVGNDAARFFYVMRKIDQHMDFDLDLAKSSSNDNPVYYVQYAHARICSVLRQLTQRGLVFDEEQGLAALDKLALAQEIQLITCMNRYQDVIKLAALNGEPHHVAYFLRELATSLHSYYNAVTLLCPEETLRHSRICLLKAVRQVICNGLQLLGVSCPETM